MRKLPICTILGVKPTILVTTVIFFSSGSRPGTFPNAKFCKNGLSGWALIGKVITKIAKFDGIEFLGYGFLLVFNSNYMPTTHR